MMKENVAALNLQFIEADPEAILAWFINEYNGRIAFSTSLGAEDQVITCMLAALKMPVKIFTLDTGRLFQETYDILEITRNKYGIDIEVYFPEAPQVEKMVNTHGVNLFYDSIENHEREII